ncbi:MAG: hypothetical protein ACLU38_05470 [Dysosmobacter sp.]
MQPGIVDCDLRMEKTPDRGPGGHRRRACARCGRRRIHACGLIRGYHSGTDPCGSVPGTRR